VRAADKVLSRDELARRLAAQRGTRGKVVFTNGVFDLLHVGHVRYLEFARGLGDLLVVGVNSDDSVKLLEKGHGRPFVPADERAEVVAALACVDYVCTFDEMRPDATIRVLRPNVHVKGEQYAGSELPEAGAVREVGGEIVFAPHIEGRSTSELIARIEEAGP
jgi:D-beta-D-heptose 7-phosphate kinase/D-beta-D-heptose 1-phosphate adenosyltransferase